MGCQRCSSGRILGVRARAKDQHTYEYKGKVLENSYGCDFSKDGDTTELDVCLDCGQVQGEFPMQSVLDNDE